MTGMALEQKPQGSGVDFAEVLTAQQTATVSKVASSHMLRLVRGELNGMPHRFRAAARF